MENIEEKSYKKYLVLVYFLLLVYTFGNYFVWAMFTEEALYTGDLSRLGYVDIGRGADAPVLDNTTYVTAKNMETDVDILLIGDSFLEYHQSIFTRYLKEVSNKNVYNFAASVQTKIFGYGGNNPYATLLHTIENGYIDKIHPNVVVVECVERSCLERTAIDNSGISMPLDEMMTFFPDNSTQITEVVRYTNAGVGKQITIKERFINALNINNFINGSIFFNLANYKTILAYYRLHNSENNNRQMSDNTNVSELNDKLFNSNYPDKLFYFVTEINSFSEQEFNEKIKLSNDNINKTAQLLKSKGIDLYILFAPDKLTLYHDYLVEPLPNRRAIFDAFRAVDKDYGFLDGLAYLKPYVDNGERDIYMANDTHWSNKAQIIAVEKAWEDIKKSFN